LADAICAACRFWQPPPPGAPGGMGQCRKSPPVPFMVLAQAPGQSRLATPGAAQAQAVQPMFPSAWPPAPPDGWCGEWLEIREVPKEIAPPA
jgi:hypothetical protein